MRCADGLELSLQLKIRRPNSPQSVSFYCGDDVKKCIMVESLPIGIRPIHPSLRNALFSAAVISGKQYCMRTAIQTRIVVRAELVSSNISILLFFPESRNRNFGIGIGIPAKNQNLRR